MFGGNLKIVESGLAKWRAVRLGLAIDPAFVGGEVMCDNSRAMAAAVCLVSRRRAVAPNGLLPKGYTR